jgi:hypothetical protein
MAAARVSFDTSTTWRSHDAQYRSFGEACVIVAKPTVHGFFGRSASASGSLRIPRSVAHARRTGSTRGAALVS